jgi:glutamate carboxypeptidase
VSATQTVDVAAILEDLRGLVETESPSSDSAALHRSADAVDAVLLRRLGRESDRIVLGSVPHLSSRWGTQTRTLLLAHHDTVWPLGTLRTTPFRVEEGVITGPGCFDMKLGLVMAVHALALVHRRRGMLDGIALLVIGDEETGSTTSRDLIERTAAQAEAVLVLEPSGDGGALKTARKGTSGYRLEVTGRAAHAGLEPETGINAAVALASLIPRIVALAHPEVGTTVTPTTLSAGTSTNTVPAFGWLDVDVRARTVPEQERVDQQIKQLTPDVSGASIVITGGPNRPPLESRMTQDLFVAAVRAAQELGHVPPQSLAVGGASDGNFTAAMGIPTLDGLGAVGGGAHAADEHALVAWIEPRTRLLADLILRTLEDAA